MGVIYSEAAQVWIWLGKEDEASAEEVFSILSQRNLLGEHDEFPPMAIDHTLSMESLAQLNHFFQRPYFHRLWVLQEMFLARELVLMCGELRCPTLGGFTKDDLSVLEYRILRVSNSGPGSTIAQCALFDCQRGNDSATDCRPLLEYLRMRMHHKCTDPRDKVFGLLACIVPEQRIPVDYAQAAEAVFWTTLRAASENESFIFLFEPVDRSSRLHELQAMTYLNELQTMSNMDDYHTILRLRAEMGLDDIISTAAIIAQLLKWVEEGAAPMRVRECVVSHEQLIRQQSQP